MNDKILENGFEKKSLDFTQNDMDNYLKSVHINDGFELALEKLFEWEVEVGYLTTAHFTDIKRYSYFDEKLNITFKAQINIIRSRYTPKPPNPNVLCPICFENVGLTPKENLRAYNFILDEREFFAQLTPFPLTKKHFVVVDKKHTPMIMDTQSIIDMLNFITLAPNYTACSNSDIEWAGSSILSHHHYQMFYDFNLPIMEAVIIDEFSLKSENSRISLLNYPIASCRIDSNSKDELIKFGGNIIKDWKEDNLGKNTCNLILKSDNDTYSLYIIFRNSEYRTPDELTNIKSEGVGIIEVAGEGIYPVPKDESIWDIIDKDGLRVIKGIIDGNNPIARNNFDNLFNLIKGAI